MKTFALCFTGISGSGKSTIANSLKKYLESKNSKCQLIDGDILRQQLGHLFGYTREERIKNSQVVRVLSKYLNQNGISTIVAIVAPYEEMRKGIREYIGENYIEVFVDCPYEECVKRDIKGYYKKQLEGTMSNLNGADDIYEVPKNSDIILHTEKESIDESVQKIVDYLRKHDYAI